MYIEQLYTGCLSEAAYYVESDGEACIIDPMRDINSYLDLAKKRNATIKYIFETHFHADFISGHLDLAKKTGAPIIYGPDNKAKFKVTTAKDGQEFPLGRASIKVLHTPGHTLESVCYLALDEQQNPYAVFTGDTLFIGDVGRPDLSQKNSVYSTTDLAGFLYESLEKQIKTLPDEVLVYPAHGAGSSCGKNLSSKTVSTIKEQKETNYALQQAGKESFIVAVTEGLAEPPAYFPINAEINKKGYSDLEEVLANALTPLTPNAFENKMEDDNTLIIDSRNADAFTAGYVPKSIFIGLDGRFAEWAGQLIPFDKNILLVTEPGKEKETATRLARVGFEKMVGYLDGSIEAWQKAKKPIDMIVNVEADEVAMDYPFDQNMIIVDVRKPTEYTEEHIKKAVNISLSNLKDPANSLSDIDDHFNLYLHCAGGYRSVIAASIFKKEGFHNLRNILGGYKTLATQNNLPKESGMPKAEDIEATGSLEEQESED